MRVKVQPNASKSAFAEVYGDDAIKVRIQAPAIEGAANKELLKLFSKSFNVSKSAIMLKTGHYSRVKVLEFPLTEKFQTWVETYI